MRHLTFVCAAIWSLQGCSNESIDPRGQEAKSPDQANEQQIFEITPSTSLTTWLSALRSVSGTRLDLPRFASDVEQVVTILENSENMSRGEARNELFLRLTEGQSELVEGSMRGNLAQVILADPRGVDVAVSELPAGPLRKTCVSYLTGGSLPLETLADVYHALPESADRSRMAEWLVARTYFERGADSAIEAIRSLSLPTEQTRALEELAGQIFGAIQIGERPIPSEDIEAVKAYARSVGQEHQVRAFGRIEQLAPRNR
jgi:hypothetical protein